MDKLTKKDKPTIVILIVLCGLLVLTVSIIILGMVADSMGTSCTGLMGGLSSCVDSYLLAAMIYTPLLIFIGIFIYIVKKAYDYIEKKGNPKPKRKKK